LTASTSPIAQVQSHKSDCAKDKDKGTFRER
jgi:hypothetical protein